MASPGVQRTSVTGVGVSAPLHIDHRNVGSNPGLFLNVGAGCTCSVEVTPDDIFNPTVTPVWYSTNIALFTGATIDHANQLPFAATAVRLNQTAGANTTVLQVVGRGII
jgi:hypothetical protein